MHQWPEYEAQVWLLARMTGWTLDYIDSLPPRTVMEGLQLLDAWDAGLAEAAKG